MSLLIRDKDFLCLFYPIEQPRSIYDQRGLEIAEELNCPVCFPATYSCELRFSAKEIEESDGLNFWVLSLKGRGLAFILPFFRLQIPACVSAVMSLSHHSHVRNILHMTEQ